MEITFTTILLLLIAFAAGGLISLLVYSHFLKNKLSWPQLAKIILTVFFIVFIADVLWQNLDDGFSSSDLHFDLTNNANVPAYLAFMAAVLSGVIIYETFDNQRKSNQLAAFENRFFKFIDYHRENVNELLCRDPNRSGDEYVKGNRVFAIIYNEIKNLLQDYFMLDESEKFVKSKEEVISFVYNCVFYGASEEGIMLLMKKYGHVNFDFGRFMSRKAEYDKSLPFHSGHVRRLGHFFRNIYQAVKYVDDQKFLSPNEKYDYVSILKAQMSVYEQAVFFFNSISDLGSNWEIDKYKMSIPTGRKNRQEVINELWVTKYDLISSTLNNDGEISEGINIREFYPLLVLEREHGCAKSGCLPFSNNDAKICRFCFNEKYLGYENRMIKERLNRYMIDHPDFKTDCEEPDCVTRANLP